MEEKRIYDPEILEAVKDFPRLNIADAAGARAVVEEMNEKAFAEGAVRLTDDRIEEIERTIPGPKGAPKIPIRIYMPKDRTESGPGFVNFHGGAFILGDLESEHDRCLIMARDGGAVSVGVDYRLAPEHPFPAGVEDCYAALNWVVDNADELKIDPVKITIGGGSAGGNLTAAVALIARDRGGPAVAYQMLIYPVLDDRCNTPSMKNGADIPIWNYQNSIDMWNQYIGKDRGNVSPYASPARCGDLSGLPPAYVMTAEFDPLRDEAIIYATRMMEAGVQVELHNFPGTVHGFDINMESEISTLAVQEGVAAFRRMMALL